MHPLSIMDPSKCGAGITARDRSTWSVNTLKLLEQFPTIKRPDDEEGQNEDMDIGEGQIPPTQIAPAAAKDTGIKASNKGKAPTTCGIAQARQSEGDTSPERRAYNAPVDPTRIKKWQNNRFQPLEEEHIYTQQGTTTKSGRDQYQTPTSQGELA